MDRFTWWQQIYQCYAIGGGGGGGGGLWDSYHTKMDVASDNLTLVQNIPVSLLVRKSVFLENSMISSVLLRENIDFECIQMMSVAGNVLLADAIKLGENAKEAFWYVILYIHTTTVLTFIRQEQSQYYWYYQLLRGG